MKNYEKDALILEKKARQRSYLLRGQGSEKEDVSEFYQKAGDAWIKNAHIYRLDTPRSQRFLINALADYKKALKNTRVKKEKIQKKIDSVDRTIEQLHLSPTLEKKLSFGVPVYFFVILSVFFLVSALLFISFNLTGYALANLTKNNVNVIGTVLFVMGLFFSFLYFWNKK